MHAVTVGEFWDDLRREAVEARAERAARAAWRAAGNDGAMPGDHWPGITDCPKCGGRCYSILYW